MEELIKKARQHDADAFTELMMSQMQTNHVQDGKSDPE